VINFVIALIKPKARIWLIRNYPEIRICELGARLMWKNLFPIEFLWNDAKLVTKHFRTI